MDHTVVICELFLRMDFQECTIFDKYVVHSVTRAVPKFSINLLQILDEIGEEKRQVNMMPDPQKCEVMFICPQKNFFFICVVDHVSLLLEVCISSSLNWSYHIELRNRSCPQERYWLHHMNDISEQLDYAAPVEHLRLTLDENIWVEKMQKHVCGIILHGDYTEHQNALQVQICVFKLKVVIANPRHRQPLSSTVHTVHGRNTRCAD